MKHSMTISVTKKPENAGLFKFRCVTIRERLMRFIFGDKLKLTVIIPGDSVDTVSIKEIPKGGEVLEEC